MCDVISGRHLGFRSPDSRSYQCHILDMEQKQRHQSGTTLLSTSKKHSWILWLPVLLLLCKYHYYYFHFYCTSLRYSNESEGWTLWKFTSTLREIWFNRVLIIQLKSHRMKLFLLIVWGFISTHIYIIWHRKKLGQCAKPWAHLIYSQSPYLIIKHLSKI